jgi:hypothetical protein
MTTPPPQDPFLALQSGAGYGQPPPGYGQPPGYDSGYGAPAGYGQPPGWGAPGAGGPPPETESKAIIALVLSIVSFFLLPVLPAIAALVLASSSKRDIEASGGRLGGEGMVTAAKVISWINIGMWVLIPLFFVLILGIFAILFSTMNNFEQALLVG